ncbi:MAG: nucleotidyltransferase domain-containing protein [Pirellulales bacterium]|nr:nucleotidyltransferase domain-containing protein [Pirellulales bacterium]
MPPAILVSEKQLADYCTKWKIRELSVFGSVLRDDFTSASDVDILVTFDKNAGWGLGEHGMMQEELSALLGRNVDLVSLNGLEKSRNWIRKQEILEHRERIYAAG